MPAIRRAVDSFDLEMASDFQQGAALYALKEELYYVIDEKQQQADLTEKGRTFINPDDPDAFMLPDFPTQFIEIDKREGYLLMRSRPLSWRRRAFSEDKRAHPLHQPASARLQPLRARQGIRRAGRQGEHRRPKHGPCHAGSPLVGWPPSGGRSEGELHDREGDEDLRERHHPELFPDV